MPVYEYRCQECGNRFDQLVRSLGATEEIGCRECGSSSVRRMVSSFAMAGVSEASGPASSGAGGCCGGSCGCGH